MMAENKQTWDAGGGKDLSTEECSQQEAKFRQMQEYIPFLETMISKLERTRDKSREAQLSKMKSLHAVLTNSKKMLKIETLMKCEEVLKKLREKVDKVPGIQESLSAGTKQENATVGGELTKSASTRDKSEAVVSSTTPQPSAYVAPLKKAVARVSDDSPSRMSPVPTVTSSQSDNCVSSTETRLPEDILAQSREKLTKIIDISSDNSSDIEWIYDRRKDVLSGKEKALKNASVSKLLSYDIASAMDWVCETDKSSVNKNTPLSQSLSITYNISKYSDRASKSTHELQASKHFWDSHSENKLSTVEESRDAASCTEERENNSSSAYNYEGQSLLSEDENTASKKDEGVTSRSLRAKLEEEIHKVHRVGVSTGGALRGLINKDDRKISPVKTKPEKLNIDTLSPARSLLEKVDKTSSCSKVPDHSAVEEKTPLFSRSPSRLDKWKGSSDPRKRQSIEQPSVANTPDSDAVKQVEPKSNENSDPRLKLGSGYAVKNFQTTPQPNQSDNKGKSHSLLSSLSSEDLQRIVHENLQSLPSPPPNTKEILETVKAASPMTNKSVNITHSNVCSPAHTPESSQLAYPGGFRPQGTAFGQQQIQGSGTYGYENSLEQPNSTNRPALLPTPGILPKPGIPPTFVGTQSHPDVMYGAARQRDVDGLKITQHGHQGGVVDPRLNVHRSGVVEQRVSKDPRLNTTDYSQSSPVEQWPGSPCYGILSRPVSDVSVVEYNRESGPVHHSGRQVDHRSRDRCTAPVQQFSPHVSPAHMWPNQQQAVMQHQPYGGRSDASYLQQHAHQSQMGHPAASANQNMPSSFYASRAYRAQGEPSPSLLGPGPMLGRRAPILSERDPRRRSIEDTDAARSSRLIERRPRTPDPRHSRSRDRRSRSRDRRRDVSSDRRRDVSSDRRRDVSSDRRRDASRDRRRDVSCDRWRDGSNDRKRESSDRRHGDSSDRRRDERHSESLSKSERDSQRGKTGAKEIISPLNSLYDDSSVPKTGKGYGFQHFRIPKIKRDPPHVHRSRSPVPVTKSEEERSSVRTKVDETSADEKPLRPTVVDPVESTEKGAAENSVKAESIDITETCPKKTEELTQELIESFIRRSFECGEGKKLLDNAIFLENLNEKLKAKKLQKIKRILESDSDDSDSDSSGKSKKNTKAKQNKKKDSDEDDGGDDVKEDKKKTRRRRVIVSDESDEDNDDVGDNKTTVKQHEKSEVNEDDTEDEKPLSELSKVKNAEEEKRKPKSAMISPKTKAKTKKKVTIDVKESDKNRDKQNVEEQKSSENESGCDGKSTEKKGRGVKQMKKHRRRSPLELLQEDIREMFISEGVVTATGYRMCRLLKEVKPGMSIEEVSKTEAKRMQEEAEMECENFSKTRRQRGRRKTITDFSDDGYDEDEEDDDYEYNSKEFKAKPGRKKKYDHQKHQYEQSKNQLKVVLQKTCAPKMDLKDVKSEDGENLSQTVSLTAEECRRLARSVWRWASTQIPSREDEEIDVSERKSTVSAKASDHQSAYEYVETQDPFCFKRTSCKRRTKPRTIKIEDVIKKLTENAFGETCKEQDVAEPCASSGAAQSIDDVENETTNDTSLKNTKLLERQETEQFGNKKPVTPRKSKKKKASAWQLGIIKKKSVHKCKFDRSDLSKSPASFSVDDSDLESKLGDDLIADKEKTDTIRQGCSEENGKIKTPRENLSDISNEKSKFECVQMKNECLSDDIKTSDLEVSKRDEENVGPELKLDSLKSKGNKSETKQVDISQEAYNSHREHAVDKMYAFDGSPKYPCKLCSYFGRGITNHYKTQHPNSEVYISRLNLAEAAIAVSSSQKTEFDDCATQTSGDRSRKQSLFKCRMCDLITNKVNTFYDHLTTHTGEYRYECDVCQFTAASRPNFKSHFLTHHPGFDIKTNILHTVNNTERIVFGYICTACNFVQIEKKNVEKHVEMAHSDSDFSDSQLPKVLLINMSKHSTDVPDTDGDQEESSLSPTKQEIDEYPNSKLENVDCEVSGDLCKIAPKGVKTNISDDKCDENNSNALSHVSESAIDDFTNANVNSEVGVNNEPEETAAAVSNSDAVITKNAESSEANKLPGVDHKETCDDVPEENHKEETVSTEDSNSTRSRVTNVEEPKVVQCEAVVDTRVQIKDSDHIRNETNTTICEVASVKEATPVQIENTNNACEEESIKTATSEMQIMDKTTAADQNTMVNNSSAKECTEVSKDEVPNLESVAPTHNETESGPVQESSTNEGGTDDEHDSTPPLENAVSIHEEMNAILKIQNNLNPPRTASGSEENEKSSFIGVVDETEENRKRRISAFVPSDTTDQHEEMLHNERYKTMEAITQSLKFKPVIKSSIDVLIESIDIRKKQEESTNTISEPECVSENSTAQNNPDVVKSNGEGDESTLIDERRALEAAQAVKCSDVDCTESNRVVPQKSKDDPYSEQEILDDDVIKHSDSSLFDKIFSPALNKIQKKELKKQSTVKVGVTSSNYTSSPAEGDAVEIELLSEDKIRNLSESSFEGDHESSLPLIVQRLAKHISDPSALVIGDDENDIDSEYGVSEMREFEDAAMMSQNESTADSSDADSVNYDELYDAAAAYEKRIMGLSGSHISDSVLPSNGKKCKYSYSRASPVKPESGHVASGKQDSSKFVCSPPPAIAIRKDKKIFSANTFGTPDIRVGSFSARLYGSSKVLFSCLIQGCIFQSTHVSNFSEHLRTNHKSSYWDGFCQTCKFNIKGEGARNSHVAHIVAFNHLLDEHVLTDRCFLNDSGGKKTLLLDNLQHTGKSDGAVDSEVSESDEGSSGLGENTASSETGVLSSDTKEDGARHSSSEENIKVGSLSGNILRTSDGKTPVAEGRQVAEAYSVEKDNSLKSSAEGAVESDTSESTDTTDSTSRKDTQVCNQPKIYLRTRRLSGDKLSGHKDGPDVQSSLCDTENLMAGENDSSGADDVSFIKITTVVSLNPNAENSVGGIEDLDIIENDSTVDEDSADTTSCAITDASPPTQESLHPDCVVPKEPQVLNAVLLTPGIAVSSGQSPRMQLVQRMKLTTASDVPVASNLRPKGAVQLQQPIVWSGAAGTALTPARVVRIAPKVSPAVTKVNQPTVQHIIPKSRTETRSPNLQAGKSSSSKPNSTSGEASPNNEWLPSHKNFKVRHQMLTVDSLRNLYKCMDKNCYYTENGGRNFLNHLRSQHFNKKGSDWNRCSYCPFRGDGTAHDLIQHITRKHGHCQYQCAYCFFRGMACSYVVLHQNTGHINKPVKVLLCTDIKVNPPTESELEPLVSVVHPYICDQGSCGERFYNPKDFLLHLQWQHNQVSTLTCHICKAPCLKAARLVSHYKFHSISLYQCRHCPHGAETEEEIQQHLCNMHHNLPALAVLRHYEPTKQSAPGGDVNRLKIVNLEQSVSGDVISRPSESAPVAGGVVTSIQSEMCAQEDDAGTNQAPQVLFSQMTENEIIDAVQNASFEIVENQETEAAQESEVADIPEKGALPGIAPVQLPKDSSALQETNIKGEVSDSSPCKEQAVENNDDDYDHDDGVDEDDDVQVLYYQLATKGKQCSHVACKGSCKLRKSHPGKESPVNKLKNSVNELIKETDSQNSSDSVILLTKSCPEATAKESELAQEHTNCESFLGSTPNKFTTKISIQNAESGSNIDSESETNSCAESVNTTYGAVKPQTIQASEGSAMTEDSVIQGDQRKQFMASGLTGEDLYLCGNARCEYRAATASQLREHLCVCDLSREGVLRCPHCSRPFKAFNTLVDHLRIHGVPRYSCALCTYRATAPTAVAKHLKHQHKVSCTETVPVDRFLNNHETDMFVVCPKGKGRPKRNPTGRVVKTIYRPEEIHLLPMSAILKDPIECSVCSFKTKVRSNMKRHLGLHLDPDVDPADIPTVEVVNPVPCLERNEKMFDKMTNLAASSNIGVPKPTTSGTSSGSGTAVTAGAANEEGQLQQQQYVVPQYVEEHRRYVCSAAGCSYLTCSEAMLRHHLRALHLDEVVYRCPHCPPSAPEVPLERLGAHLRMHGDRLYGCAHCPYFHFQRHIVERHLVDRHPEKRAFVVVIRESEAAQAQTSTESTTTGTADALFSPPHALWVCGLCDAQCQSRVDVLDHVLAAHGIKSQYKCSLCAFRTSSKTNFEPHFVSRHPGERPYIMDVYRRVEMGGGGVVAPAVSTEPTFDTRPLWSRNSAGVRHIRGILIEEESQIKENITEITDTARKVTLQVKKENADSALQRTPTSGSSQIKKEIKSEIKQDMQEESTNKQSEDNDRELVGAFGPYGKPAAGNLYVCTLCERYKTKFRGDMRDHLYRELNYSKWVCTHCRLMSCSRSHLQKHSAKVHDKNHKPEAIAALPPDKEIEEWVEKVLTTQYSLMKQQIIESQTSQPLKKPLPVGIKRSHSETQLQEVHVGGTGSPGSSGKEEQDAASATTSQPTKRAAALLARALSQTSMLDLSEPLPPGSPVSSPKGSDIEDPGLEKKQDFTSSPEHKKKTTSKEPKITCMDCGTKCVNVRGLKLHIRMNHMCTAKWLCGHCRQGGSTEMAIKQHCRVRHRGLPELVKYNEEAASLKLDDEFWETNYGLPPKTTTTASASSPSPLAHQPESLSEEGDSQTELPELLTAEEARRCSHCSYSCRSPSDLRKHEMRHWVQKPFKCGYCSFEAIREYEVKKHSEKVHPQQPVSVKQKEVPLQPDIKPLRIKRHHAGNAVSSSNTELEVEDSEEQTPQVASSAESDSEKSPAQESVSDVSSVQKKTKIFRCFYCPRRATSLAVIHEHWQKTHKTKAVCANGVTRLGLPFSYKEMAVDDVLKGSKKLHMNRTAFVCVYCKRKGSRSILLKHHEESHPNKEFSIVEATAHHYECSKCSFVALALHVLRRHFETEHRDSEFRYIVKPSKQPGDESDNVIVRTETAAVKRPSTSSTLFDAGNYVCLLCCARTDSEEQFHSDHHSMHHPNVEPKYCFETAGHEAKRTKFECPRCCFISDNYEVLKEHLERHIKPFKCGYCAQQYDLESKVVRHCQFSHVDCDVRVIHIRESEVENLKKLVIQRNVADDESLCTSVPVSEKKGMQNVPHRIRNVARKSTALSSVSARLLIKSLSANRSEEDSAEPSESDDSSTESPYSFYGRSPSPIDENRLLAFANYGGSVIRMSLSTFSKLYNIYPKVKVRDLKHQKLAPI
ncbi:uncharacterized protein LOC124545909 [Schistocerca americana]|uniref:uncharacterized protein LOC124545909 n=1 Tax=Schistocerca americana TaxID=7009 RepID=UPI001F4F52CC|nr:uncharacterized protein LOC124545909 [Schistocerca americana]